MNSTKHWIAITRHYGSCTVLEQVNDQSDQQCKFLGVHNASVLCVGSWSAYSWGVVLKLGECYCVRRCKNMTFCDANANSSEAARFHNSIFSTLQMSPLPQCRLAPPFPPSLICTTNFVKIGPAVPEICSRTETQTDRQTDRNIAILRSPTRAQ